jgi:para-aminobenzoate synthetase component 1
MKMDSQHTLLQLLAESQKHNVACICVSNGFDDPYGRYDYLAGFGEKLAFYSPEAITQSGSLKMGFCSYDFKNTLENLTSIHPQAVMVPDFYFFEPEYIYKSARNVDSPETNFILPDAILYEQNGVAGAFFCRTSKGEYLENVQQIKECIKNGDFYEMNYCLQFECDNCLNPYALFAELNRTAPAPFATFFKYNDKFLLCSSPERFLAKNADCLIAQPIKGTRKRHLDTQVDIGIKESLAGSTKDRAENIMIVDLLRNDLSRVCLPGSVNVPELCKVYSFSHVHQMISTVTGELRAKTKFADILKASFPMGSMTGAPKIQVMNDIEHFENFSRGWYSGSVGYWENDDFDLNVVIRSLQLDTAAQKMYYHVGGAITFDSIPEEEYNECLQKASGLMQALKNQEASNL